MLVSSSSSSSFVILFQINACNGFYCDGFWPNSANKPKLWTEDWNGWYDETL